VAPAFFSVRTSEIRWHGILMTDDNKNLAEFARLALAYELLTVSEIRQWGDLLLLSSDDPANWMIEVSLINPENAYQVLKAVPGRSDDRRTAELTCVILTVRWKSGQADIHTVRRVGWDFHLLELLPEIDQTDWGVVLEVECEGLSEGWRTESEVKDLINESLAQYQALATELPDWVEV
jgi:hypothetical protein